LNWSALIKNLQVEDEKLLSVDDFLSPTSGKLILAPATPDTPLLARLPERLKKVMMCETCGSHVRELYLDHVRQVKAHSESDTRAATLNTAHLRTCAVLVERHRRKTAGTAWTLIAKQCRERRRLRAILKHRAEHREISSLSTIMKVWHAGSRKDSNSAAKAP